MNPDEIRGRQDSALIVEEYFSRHPSLPPIHMKALVKEILDNPPHL
jgi:hypothetical protein